MVTGVQTCALPIFLTSAHSQEMPVNNLIVDTDGVSIGSSVVQTCSLNSPSTMSGYERLDHDAYLDLPDPIVSRATGVIEDHFTMKLAKGVITEPLTKTYCQISVTRVVVDMTYATQDDAISHISTRAVYNWVTADEIAGWQIVQLGQKSICARGRNKTTQQCL